MPRLPKLKLKKDFGYPLEEIRDFEEAQYFLFSYGPTAIVVVDDQIINSYEELIQMATQDRHKGKDFIEVQLISTAVGGG